jgi:glycine/D-amino acid oxidase-like deaminating enzyme
MRCDIAIIGGGIIGSSIAYHLARTGRAGRIVVIERDPAYQQASTPRASGGVRQLFSGPENIALSRYGLAFYAGFEQTMAVDGDPAPIGFRRQGYLFVADAGGGRTMEANFRRQSQTGVRVELLDPAAIRARWPSLASEDIEVAVHSPDDAWIDPQAAMMGFKRKARSLGAEYVADAVVGWEMQHGSARRIVLSSGAAIEAQMHVLAAGAWSGEVAAMIGMKLPIGPMSREAYFFTCPAVLEPLPFVKCESDVAFRPEGKGYTGGIADWRVADGWNWELSPDYFESVVWPGLARRVPAFETLRLERAWRGHYERNALDANAVIGRWEGGAANVVIAAGFSGHGVMHAPGAGLAVAELILDGRYSSIDPGRLGYRRIAAGEPYREQGII